jgi:tetratricopeptide (TPR) repeat protein
MQGYQAAEILLKMVLAADSSDNPEVMNSLAMLLQIMDRPDEAADLYRKILAIIPNAPMVVNNLAWLMCEEQAQYQEALAMTDAVLLKFPEYIDLIDTRGMIYYRMQQYDEAISDFNKCVELYPKNNPGLAATYFHLGRAQAATGSRTAAITNLKLAIEINESKSTLSKEQLDEMRKLMDGLAG